MILFYKTADANRVDIKTNAYDLGSSGVLVPGWAMPERKTQTANEESDLMNRD